MTYLAIRLVVATLTFFAGLFVASTWSTLNRQEVQTESPFVVRTDQRVASVETTPCSDHDSPIRKIEFEVGIPMDYGDVTGDGQEEAVIMEGLESGGSAIPYRVHVYTLRRGRPKLLWRFDTGDRADGGLRRVYVDDGNLTVELYGKNSTIEDPYSSDGNPACCATYFNRMHYEWNGRKFRPTGERQILIHTSGGASPELDDLPYQRCTRDVTGSRE
jgi:hypothetical protein